MAELDDSFTTLLGRQPTDKEKQALYRTRDALNLKTTDAVWLLLMALQHYETLYEQVPARIATAVRDITDATRAAAEAAAKAAQEATRKASLRAVHDATVGSASAAARAQIVKGVSIAGSVICVSLLLVGLGAFKRGREQGLDVGENFAKRECRALVAASSWVNTPEGELALGLAKVGSLSEVARCEGRGMVAREGWCTVPSEHGRFLARWPLPPSARASGGSP